MAPFESFSCDIRPEELVFTNDLPRVYVYDHDDSCDTIDMTPEERELVTLSAHQTVLVSTVWNVNNDAQLDAQELPLVAPVEYDSIDITEENAACERTGRPAAQGFLVTADQLLMMTFDEYVTFYEWSTGFKYSRRPEVELEEYVWTPPGERS